MKHIPSDTYNLAWFKLAECVERGEQEEAFGLHRLLAHSLANKALTEQLAGDIFLAFKKKEAALAKYEQAAHLYEIDQQYNEAKAIYAHISTINPKKSIAEKNLTSPKSINKGNN